MSPMERIRRNISPQGRKSRYGEILFLIIISSEVRGYWTVNILLVFKNK